MPGLLQTLRQNLGHGNSRLKAFEVANSFFPDPLSETGVKETGRLAVLLHGSRHKNQWPYPEEEYDYSDIKGLVENLVKIFTGKRAKFYDGGKHSYLSPAVLCSCDNQELGILGRVKSDMSRIYKARKDLWFADINLDLLQDMHNSKQVSFENLPRFPVVKRDMTVVAPMNLKYEQITDVVFSSGISILEDMTLVDIYFPEVGQEKKMTFRLTYRHPEKTLKDKEVDKVHQKLADSILDKLPVRFS